MLPPVDPGAEGAGAAGAPAGCDAPGAPCPAGGEAAAAAPPDQAAGTGPGAGGFGPYFVGAAACRSASHPSPNVATSTPIAAVNASSSVRPSAYERMSETSDSGPYVRTR